VVHKRSENFLLLAIDVDELCREQVDINGDGAQQRVNEAQLLANDGLLRENGAQQLGVGFGDVVQLLVVVPCFFLGPEG